MFCNAEQVASSIHLHRIQTITIEYMSKKLFTRLQLSTPDANSQRVVTALLESIVATSAERFEQKQMNNLSRHILTKEVMYKEVNTVGQAFPTNPIDEPLAEDQVQKLQIREGNRPFSAKIEKLYRQSHSSSKKSIYGNFKRGSTRSSYKYSMCQSTKSKQPKRYGNFRPNNNDKFFPLECDKSLDDSFEQAFIDSLRERKAQQLAYQRSKENFLKTSAQESEKYAKLNKKFLQTMSSKTYYYNKNGETVQVNQAASRMLKKASSNRISARQEQTKRGNEVRSELTVEYQQKENYFKRTREAFQIDARPPVLFYKSEQCKYQIIA